MTKRRFFACHSISGYEAWIISVSQGNSQKISHSKLLLYFEVRLTPKPHAYAFSMPRMHSGMYLVHEQPASRHAVFNRAHFYACTALRHISLECACACLSLCICLVDAPRLPLLFSLAVCTSRRLLVLYAGRHLRAIRHHCPRKLVRGSWAHATATAILSRGQCQPPLCRPIPDIDDQAHKLTNPSTRAGPRTSSSTSRCTRGRCQRADGHRVHRTAAGNAFMTGGTGRPDRVDVRHHTSVFAGK